MRLACEAWSNGNGVSFGNRTPDLAVKVRLNDDVLWVLESATKVSKRVLGFGQSRAGMTAVEDQDLYDDISQCQERKIRYSQCYRPCQYRPPSPRVRLRAQRGSGRRSHV